MNEEKKIIEDIIAKSLQGHCDAAELTQLRDWMRESKDNVQKYFRMEELYLLGKKNSTLSDAALAKAEKRLKERIEAAEERRHINLFSLRFTIMKYVAVAAVALLLGGICYWYSTEKFGSDMIVAYNDGAVKEVVLPDGTHVWLNNQATIKYPSQFDKSQRKVYLSGEAYFEVTKNKEKPFVVTSDAMQVTVLGTIFNFKCEKDNYLAEVSLIEGSVEVEGNHNEGKVILTPGQKAEVDHKTKSLIVKHVDAQLDAVWHNDLIPFEATDIYYIATTLERFYDVKINLSDNIKLDNTYSGVIKRTDSIENVLKSLQNTIPMKYKIVGKSVYISKSENGEYK